MPKGKPVPLPTVHTRSVTKANSGCQTSDPLPLDSVPHQSTPSTPARSSRGAHLIQSEPDTPSTMSEPKSSESKTSGDVEDDAMGTGFPGPQGPPEDTENQQMARIMGTFFSGRARVDQLIQKVGSCDGSDPEKTLKWMRAVSDTDCPLALARATAEGPLADHLRGCQDQWPVVKTGIATTFISAAFEQRQRDALRAFSQRPGESITTYNFEFMALVKEGYPALPTDQSDLVRLYLSNLANRNMAESLVQKAGLTTLEAAMQEARKKARAGELLIPKATAKGRTAETSTLPPPELAAITQALQAMTSVVQDIASSQKTLEGKVAAIGSSAQKSTPHVAKRRASSTDLCYRCGKPGHFAADCRQPMPTKKGPPQSTSAQVKCDRCRRTDHEARHCKTGPPKRPCFCGEHHWAYDCTQKREGVTQASTHQNQGN